MPLSITETFQKLKPFILGLIDDRVPGANVTGYGVSPRVAIWEGPYKLTSDAGLTTDIANSMYVVSDGGGIRNASDSAGLLFNTNGSIQVDNGGNARGTESVDLQNTRTLATEVVSGDYAFGTGARNTVSGNYAAGFGYFNEISGAYGLIQGSESYVTADYAIALGEVCNSSGTYSYTQGQSCQASGTRGHAVGTACISDADYAWTTGRRAKAGGYAGVWIWADHTNADFSGIVDDEVAMRARGGFRHAYDNSNYMSRSVASNGNTTFDITAGSGTPAFTFGKDINAPSIVLSVTLTLPNTGLHILDTDASHDLILKPGSDLSADRTLTITTGDADRTVTLSGNPTLDDWFDQDVKTTSSPTFVGVTLGNTGLHILDTDASHDLILKPGSDLSADRTLTITTGDADRTITLSGNPTLDDWFDQGVKQASTPEFAGIGVSTTSPTYGIDISYGGLTLITGADLNATSRTNNTTKYSRIVCSHYQNAEEPLGMIMGVVTLSDGYVYIGGGSTAMNAATAIRFYTAGNNTTTVGNEVGRWNKDGDLLIGTTTPAIVNSGKVLIFGDNVNNPTVGSNCSGLYGKDVSGTVEQFAIDEAGNAAQLTPHNYTLISPTPGKYSWVSYFRNEFLGLEKSYDLEGVFDWIVAQGGPEFRVVRELPTNEHRDWDAEQRRRAKNAARNGRPYTLKQKPVWFRGVMEV